MRASRLVPLLLLSLLTLDVLAATMADGFAKLAGTNFRHKTEAIDLIANSGDPRAIPVLEALLDGRLYARRDDRRRCQHLV